MSLISLMKDKFDFNERTIFQRRVSRLLRNRFYDRPYNRMADRYD